MSKIEEIILNAFLKVKKEDNDLPNDVHERTQVFRFAHYLANIIENDNDYSEYKVDVEFNRINNSYVKKLDDHNILPDLIVHKRGIKENLIVIEFKKETNSQKDKERLIKLKTHAEFLYKNVYFIEFNNQYIEKYEQNNWIKIGDHHE